MQWNTYLILKITYKTYKELLKINNKKANNPVFNISKNLNRLLTKEDTQMANKHMKKCSTAYATRELQIKTTMSYHSTSIKVAKIQKPDNVKSWWEYRELLYITGENTKGIATLEDSLAVFTMLTIHQKYNLTVALLGI